MAQYNPDRHHRRSIRLKGYDYALPGAYFVTLNTWHGKHLFGRIVDDKMQLTEYGEIVRTCWDETLAHFSRVELDTFVVMPNHVHLIIILTDSRGTREPAPTDCAPTPTFGKPIPDSLPTIIRSLKSAITKRINELRDTPGAPVWQRNYYERIIRNEHELDAVRRYIINNPANWNKDTENAEANK
jgi:putative transposase